MRAVSMESSVTFHTFVGLFVFFDTFQVMKDKAALELYQWKNELLYGPLPVGEEVRGGGVYLYPAAAERTDAAQGRGGGGGGGDIGQTQHSLLELSERKGGFVTGFKAVSAA